VKSLDGDDRSICQNAIQDDMLMELSVDGKAIKAMRSDQRTQHHVEWKLYMFVMAAYVSRITM
jgi:hypothetical protein